MSNIGVILLAAGASTRLGQQKQTLEYNGTSLLGKAVTEVQNSQIGEVLIVLGHNAPELSEIVKNANAHFVVNPDWENGMGNSLKFGLKEILKTKPDLDALLITVCDQPYMNSSHLEKMAQIYRKGSKIVASCYVHMLGVPVLYDREFFEELLSISDNTGAKSVLMNHPNEIEKVAFPKGEIDIDEPDDLKYLV